MKFTISKLSLLSSAICLSLFSACGSDDSSSAIADDNVLSSSSQESEVPSSSTDMSGSEKNSSGAEEISSSSEEVLSSSSTISSSSVQSTDVEEDDVKPVHPVVDISFGTLTDERDGKTYKTVSMGEQTYMAENLNYEATAEGVSSVCYNNSEDNCVKYGRLYEFPGDAKICPEGWHVPSYQEYEVVIKMLDPTVKYNEDDDELHSMTAARYLKKSSEDWKVGEGLLGNDGVMVSAEGTDEYGFSALPAGGYASGSGSFVGMGEAAVFWTSSEAKDEGDAYSLYIGNKTQMGLGGYSKDWGRSVRCIKDE